jgi:hypothetical protein
MALPIWAEYMQSVYNDSLELGIYPQDFDISHSVDLLMNCQANKQGNENNIEEEF